MTENWYPTYNPETNSTVGSWKKRAEAAQEKRDIRAAENEDPVVQAIRRVRAAMNVLHQVEAEAGRIHRIENALVECPISGRPQTLHPSVRAKLLAVLEKHAPDLLDAGTRSLPSVETLEACIERLTREAQAELADADAALAALDGKTNT